MLSLLVDLLYPARTQARNESICRGWGYLVVVCRQRHDLVRGTSDPLCGNTEGKDNLDARQSWLAVRGNVRKGVGES